MREKVVFARNGSCAKFLLPAKAFQQVLQNRFFRQTDQDVLRRPQVKDPHRRERERVAGDRSVHHQSRRTRGRRCRGQSFDHCADKALFRDVNKWHYVNWSPIALR